MMRVRSSGDHLHVGSRLSISFQRTLRIPDSGAFPLPPSLGPFPIARIRTPLRSLPRQWRGAAEFAIPLYQREALWLGFSGTDSKPNALKVAAGGVNVVSGTVWREGLHDDPQDYIVVPDQPWLDGFHTGDTQVRQFVAVPLGQGLSAEEELTGAAVAGGLQLAVYEPRPGFRAPRPAERPHATEAVSWSMGLAAGGQIRQKVYCDRYEIRAWRQHPSARIVVHLFNSDQFRKCTGREPPPSPVSAETYAQFGLPWFDVYDEQVASVAAPGTLSRLKGVSSDSSAAVKTTLDPRRLPVRRLRIGVSSAATPSRAPSRPARRPQRRNGIGRGRKPTKRNNDG